MPYTYMTQIAKRTDQLPARVVADKVIGRLRDAERALQHAVTIHQAKIVADVAAAQEVFAHRQRLGETVTGYAHQIKIHALAKLGELLAEMPKAKGTRGQLRGKDGSGAAKVEEPETAAAKYAELGLD